MKKILVMKNKEAISLYNILATISLNGSKNRIRWKFLETMEDQVFKYEKELGDINYKVNSIENEFERSAERKKANDEINVLADIEEEYVFPDREIFVEAKLFFDMRGKDETLKGQEGKMYKELEDAFLAAREEE